VTGLREVFLGAFLAVLVTVAQQGMVRLVDASGASDAPALILVLLLAAFLGVLTAVATRMAGLPGATAPTVLVLGWIVVPAVLSVIPAPAAQLFASDAALSAQDAYSLVVATVAAAVTLGVPAERR
jgi:hypothetical protein